MYYRNWTIVESYTLETVVCCARGEFHRESIGVRPASTAIDAHGECPCISLSVVDGVCLPAIFFKRKTVFFYER